MNIIGLLSNILLLLTFVPFNSEIYFHLNNNPFGIVVFVLSTIAFIAGLISLFIRKKFKSRKFERIQIFLTTLSCVIGIPLSLLFGGFIILELVGTGLPGQH